MQQNPFISAPIAGADALQMQTNPMYVAAQGVPGSGPGMMQQIGGMLLSSMFGGLFADGQIPDEKKRQLLERGYTEEQIQRMVADSTNSGGSMPIAPGAVQYENTRPDGTGAMRLASGPLSAPGAGGFGVNQGPRDTTATGFGIAPAAVVAGGGGRGTAQVDGGDKFNFMNANMLPMAMMGLGAASGNMMLPALGMMMLKDKQGNNPIMGGFKNMFGGAKADGQMGQAAPLAQAYAGDTQISLTNPSEGIIPATAAQRPENKPVIEAMVNQGRAMNRGVDPGPIQGPLSAKPSGKAMRETAKVMQDMQLKERKFEADQRRANETHNLKLTQMQRQAAQKAKLAEE